MTKPEVTKAASLNLFDLGPRGSPSRLSWAPEDRSPESSCSWRNWMMEKARRLLSVMMAEAQTCELETLQEST